MRVQEIMKNVQNRMLYICTGQRARASRIGQDVRRVGKDIGRVGKDVGRAGKNKVPQLCCYQ